MGTKGTKGTKGTTGTKIHAKSRFCAKCARVEKNVHILCKKYKNKSSFFCETSNKNFVLMVNYIYCLIFERKNNFFDRTK